MSKLLSSLPVGALVKDTGTKYNGVNPIFRVLEHGHNGDPSGSTTLEFRDIITLKCFDAKEPNSGNSDRKNYGNNRYLHSNLLQWLNSDKAAGAWYTAQHSADAAPTNENVWSNYNEYDQEKGFLANFSAELKAALQTVSKITAKNTVTDGGGYETVSSKIFLLSTTEVGLANENSVAEGSIYAYYAQNNVNAQRVKKPTAQAVSSSEYTNSSLNANSGWYYWLRTPSASYSLYARYVYSDGSLGYSSAYYGDCGVSPAFSLLSTITVSDTTDSDGAYTIEWNSAPSFNPAGYSIGNVAAAPSLALAITDADGDSFTGTVKLDGTQKATISGTGTLNYTVPISTWWNDISLGSHTITVTATDSNGASTTETYTFNRTNSAPAITPSTRDVGSISRPQTIGYSVSDAEGNAFSISVKVDNVEKISLTNQTDGSFTIPLADYWNDISVASHTITVTATDGYGASSTATYTFARVNSAPTVTPDSQDYGSSLTAPSIILTITDPEDDAYTGAVFLDGTQKATFSGTGTGSFEIPVSTWWGTMAKATQHTIVATITDSNGGTTSKTYTMTPERSVVSITGQDADLGNVWIAPVLTYQVGDTGNTACSVVEKIDGNVVRTINNVTLYTDYQFDVSGWASVGNEARHTFTVTATNADNVSVTRTWTLTKLWGELAFYTSNIPTDEAAKKINVILNYDKTGNPAVRVEVTNNACAIQATWEDATTDILAGKAYEFVNEPEEDFGIAVRVTITKNANTERVYINSLGISFA